MAKSFERKFFGTDGVRDLANTGNMTPEMALKLGRAFVKFSGAKKIIIGRDTRKSCRMLEGALFSGMSSEGAEVLLTGIIPTPGVSWAIKNYNAGGGAVISASHNPAEYNGIKFLGSDGCKLSDEDEFKIEQIILNDDQNDTHSPNQIGDVKDVPDAINNYARHLASLLKFKFGKIAFDCANGAASVIVPKLLEFTGLNGKIISSKFDGLNINANAGVMHMENLTEYVRKNNMTLGFAFDGDADRVLVSDAKGRIIDGDIILWVLARWLRAKNYSGSSQTAVTVMSNMALESHLMNEGIKTLRCPVGDRYVLDAMRSSGAALGGEQSGHIIVRDFTSTGDGICTAMLFLNAIHELNEDINTLIDRFGRYAQKLTNLKLTRPRDEVDMNTINSIAEKYQADLKNSGRVFIRTSGTEPLLRILVEAQDPEKVNSLSQILEEQLLKLC